MSTIQITGASHFVNRMYESCGRFQWAREFLKNSMESGAKKIFFLLEPQGVKVPKGSKIKPVYRRMVVDDGCGMTATELRSFFSTIGAGAKKIGSIHENFGIGAKISSLPWNPLGMVVVSYKDGVGSMIHIRLDPTTDEYRLQEFEDKDGGLVDVIDPADYEWSRDDGDIDYSAMRPKWLTDHGTIVLLLGSDDHPDTMLGDPNRSEGATNSLVGYLNYRFWDLSQHEVRVTMFSLSDMEKAAQSHGKLQSDKRVSGMQYQNQSEKNGSVTLSDGTVVRYYFTDEKEKARNLGRFHHTTGYICVAYKGEMFEHSLHKARFRNFGISDGKVQRNLRLIIEPPLFVKGKSSGVFPDQSRNTLLYTSPARAATRCPFEEWGMEFSQNLPQDIIDAIAEARSGDSGSIEDDEYRRRLSSEFGNRWSGSGFIISDVGAVAASVLNRTASKASPKSAVRKAADATPTGKERSIGATPVGDQKAEEKPRPQDLPFWRFSNAESFENPYSLACWSPNETNGPHVILNGDAPMFNDAIAYHRERYPDALADDVAIVVRRAFGFTAASKVAHINRIQTKTMSRSDIAERYLSEDALTVSVCGLIAEDALIGRMLRERIGKAPKP